MALFSRNWASEALNKAANALAAFRYKSFSEDEDEQDREKVSYLKEDSEDLDEMRKWEGQYEKDFYKNLYKEGKEDAREAVSEMREERRNIAHQKRVAALDDPSKPDFEEGGQIPEMSEDSLIEAAHKIYTDDAVMFGRDRKIANDWARQVTDDAFIESIVKTEAGEQQYIQLVEMLAQFIEMSKKYFRENYGTPEDPIEKGTFMAAYKRYRSGKNVYEAKGVKDTLPWQAYEQALMMLERSDVSFRIESGVPTIRRRGVIMPLAEDQRNPQPFMPQLTQIQQPESTMQ